MTYPHLGQKQNPKQSLLEAYNKLYTYTQP